MQVSLTVHSKNAKLGNIPSSVTERTSCPSTCSFYNGGGCYAENHPYIRQHWNKVTSTERGASWASFTEQVRKLPRGQIWRHNVAGDLPGEDNAIDATALASLVEANRGRRGFTFTHKPMTTGINRRAVKRANAGGFTVNLSADSLAQADALANLGIAPVVVVLPTDTPDRGVYTPDGRKVVVCPATTKAALTCATCQLCTLPGRKAIVGFRAHGSQARKVSLRVLAS